MTADSYNTDGYQLFLLIVLNQENVRGGFFVRQAFQDWSALSPGLNVFDAGYQYQG